MKFWRRWSLLANVLISGLIFGTPGALGQSALVPSYVFVIDTSQPMAVHKEAICKAVAACITDGLQGKMRSGEAFSIWGCNDELSVVHHFTAAWDPLGAQIIATRVAGGLETQPFQGKPCLDRAVAEASKLIAATDFLTLVIVNNGASPVRGTPFDRKIQAACAPADLGALFATTLVARGGQIIGWSVDRIESTIAKSTASPQLPLPGKSLTPVWTREGGAAATRMAARPKSSPPTRDVPRPEDKRVLDPSVSMEPGMDSLPQQTVGVSGVPMPASIVPNSSVTPQADPQNSMPSAGANLAERLPVRGAKPLHGELSIASPQAAPTVAKPEPSMSTTPSVTSTIIGEAELAENAKVATLRPGPKVSMPESSPTPVTLPNEAPREGAASNTIVQNSAPLAQMTESPALPLAVVGTTSAATKPPVEATADHPKASVAPEAGLPSRRVPLDGVMSGTSLSAVSSSSSVYLLAGLALLGLALAGLWFWMRPRGMIHHSSLISQSLDTPE